MGNGHRPAIRKFRESLFTGTRRPSPAAGFTLLELLVVIAAVAILAGLLMGATNQALKKANQATAIAQYRQIGQAITSYAAEYDATLPGPLVLSQSPIFNPADTRQLATHLGSYLGVKDLSTARPLEVFVPPAYRRDANELPLDQAILFVVNNGLVSEGKILAPFGESRAPGSPPMKTAAIPARTWLLCDADQQNPWLIGQRWATQTPAVPLHPPLRLALFLDGSIGTLTDADLQPVRRPPPPRP